MKYNIALQTPLNRKFVYSYLIRTTADKTTSAVMAKLGQIASSCIFV